MSLFEVIPSVLIGTAFIWIIYFAIINPVVDYLAKRNLKEPLNEMQEINKKILSSGFFMFISTLIFTIIGFFGGYLSGIIFFGIPFKMKQFVGTFTLMVASFAGFMVSGFLRNLGFFFLFLAAMVTAAQGIQVVRILRNKTLKSPKSPLGEAEKAKAGLHTTKLVGLLFFSDGIIVANTLFLGGFHHKEAFEKLLSLGAEEILPIHKSNFKISYSDISSIELNKGLISGNVIKIVTSKKKYKYKIRNEEFNSPTLEQMKEYANVIREASPTEVKFSTNY